MGKAKRPLDVDDHVLPVAITRVNVARYVRLDKGVELSNLSNLYEGALPAPIQRLSWFKQYCSESMASEGVTESDIFSNGVVYRTLAHKVIHRLFPVVDQQTEMAFENMHLGGPTLVSRTRAWLKTCGSVGALLLGKVEESLSTVEGRELFLNTLEMSGCIDIPRELTALRIQPLLLTPSTPSIQSQRVEVGTAARTTSLESKTKKWKDMRYDRFHKAYLKEEEGLQERLDKLLMETAERFFSEIDDLEARRTQI